MKNKKTKAYKEKVNVWLGNLILLLYGLKTSADEHNNLDQLSQAHKDNHVKFGHVHRPKLKASAVAVALVIVVGAWLLASSYLSSYSINGVKIPTNLSNAALINRVEGIAAGYRLNIVYPDKTVKSYSLKQIGLSVNAKQTAAKLLAQKNELKNRLTWWKPINASIALSKTDSIFDNFIATSTQITIEPSVDANLSISGGQINISGAVSGKEYGLVNSSGDLLDAASSLSKQSIKLRTLAVNPALTAAMLQPYKTQLQSVINQPIVFTIGDQTFKPSTSQISGWLDITPDDKSKKVNIDVNSGKVLAYIQNIASPLTRPSKAQVNMTASDGSSTQVLVPGQNGVVVSGESSIATNVASTLLKGDGISQSLSVSYKPYETITAGDYPKWIEVDLTNKRLYAYQNSNLVNTYLVSAGAPATPTVTGQYAIYSKYVSQNMTGENVDGSSYYQPNVPWINYFYKDYAIHGNYWRPLSYFGNVNSSHGCVGVVDAQAEWIYNWAPVGTPVIIHY